MGLVRGIIRADREVVTREIFQGVSPFKRDISGKWSDEDDSELIVIKLLKTKEKENVKEN